MNMSNLKITRCIIGGMVLDVLGKVTPVGDNDKHKKYRVDKPVVISFEQVKEKNDKGQEVDKINMGLSPFLQPYINQDFTIVKESDMFGDFFEVVEEVANKYLELTTGLVIPKPKIVTP